MRKPLFANRQLVSLCAAAVAAFSFSSAATAAQSAVRAGADAPTLPTSSAAFQKLDTNRDAYLSRDETSGLINFATAFNDADDNRDGRLDPDEFAKAQAIHERVRAGTYLNDTVITAKVKAALIKDRDVRAHLINVEVFKGTVQLSGFVNSEQHARRAVEIAAGISGVVEVKNALIVKS